MTIATVTGFLDPVTGYVVAQNTGTWADLTSWDSWTTWTSEPADPLVWLTDIIDLGSEQTFNLVIKTQAQGVVDYEIYTSTTGLFAGEETTTVIENGDTGVGGFTGRYVIIAIKVRQAGPEPILYGVEWKTTDQSSKLSLNNINTADLPGTTSARELTITRNIGGITNMQITPQSVSSYLLDVYVTDTKYSTTVIPRVISKGATPTFALIGVDNQPRDAIVDIIIDYLPEGYMSGNDLLLR